jgi:hypothetical protein
VTTEYKNGTVRFRDLDGAKVKTRPEDWVEVPVEGGAAYMLFTDQTGRQFCSWGGVGSAFDPQASFSSSSGNTGAEVKGAGKGKAKDRMGGGDGRGKDRKAKGKAGKK